MKRVISVFLFCSMFFSLSVPTFATNWNQEAKEIKDWVQSANGESISVSFKISEDITLITEDFENGNALFKQLENGITTYTAFVDRQSSVIYTTEYENGKAVYTEGEPFAKQAISELPNAANSLTYLGAIEYRCIPISYTSEVTRLMHLQYQSEYDGYSTYDLYGEYKTVAALAGILCSLLNLPGAIAGNAVQWLLSGLGLVVGIGPLFIPKDTILQCTETTYHWRLQDDEDSNRYTMFSGTRYRITEPTAGETEYYDGYFYVPALFREEDIDFALEMFQLLYGTVNSVRVVDWE